MGFGVSAQVSHEFEEPVERASLEDTALEIIYRTIHPHGRLPEDWRDEAARYLRLFTPLMRRQLDMRLDKL